MKIETYKIGWIKYIQSELTWGQSKKLIQMYNSITDSAFKSEEIKLMELRALLTKYNLLDRFFAVILRPRWSVFYILSLKWIPYLFFKKVSLNKAANSQVGQIFSDFFLMNQNLIQKFSEYGNALGMIAQVADQMKKEKTEGSNGIT